MIAVSQRTHKTWHCLQANLTLALWEMGDDAGAIRSARQLLRRDGAFLDMRCALAGRSPLRY